MLVKIGGLSDGGDGSLILIDHMAMAAPRQNTVAKP